jgi:hypothetical protein
MLNRFLSLPIAVAVLVSGFVAEGWAAGNPMRIAAENPDLCRMDWKDFQAKLESEDHRLSFVNSGGPMGIGLCWWHSRFQRNANYLTEYVPGTSSTEADKTAIKGIISGAKVVEISGHRNLEEFSSANRLRIEEALGCWQLTDSFIRQTWFRGAFSGSSHPAADSLQKQMDDLYDKVASKRFVIYQMLQMKGPAAHAWLVFDMKKSQEGYVIRVIDSNATQPYNVFYSYGDREVVAPPFGSDYPRFAPDTQRNSNLRDYSSAILGYCAKAGVSSSLREITKVDIR